MLSFIYNLHLLSVINWPLVPPAVQWKQVSY